MPPRKRLGQLLTELGVVDEHQLQSALGHQKQWGGKLGAVLVQKGFCKESEVVSALSKHLGMAAVTLAEAKVDPRAVKFVSRQIAEKLHVFPYEISGSGRSEVVTIAMSDPTDLSAVDQLAFHTGKRIKPMLAGDSEIVQAIHAHYGGGDEKAKLAAEAASGVRPGTAAAPTPPATTEFPRRIGPVPTAAASAEPARATPVMGIPYIPPPIPAQAPKPVQKLEEIEPDESIAAPAAPQPAEPLEIPEDDGQEMGLEPIAAHSQFGDEVSGQEDVEGAGSAGDAVEGLVSAGVPHEGAAEADQMEGLEPIAAHAQQAAPEGGWGESAPAEGWQGEPAPAEPAAAEPSGWGEETPTAPVGIAPSGDFGASQDWSAGEQQPEDSAAQEPAPESAEHPAAEGTGWGADPWGAAAAAEQPSASEQPEVPGEQLPMDAILGTAEVEGASEAPAWGAEPAAETGSAPDAPAWSAEPAAEAEGASEAPAWSAEPAAEAEGAPEAPAWSAEPAAETGSAPEAPAWSAEPANETEGATEQPSEPERQPEEQGDSIAASEAAASAEYTEAPAEQAEAPDAWASSEDPLATGGDAAAWGEAAQHAEQASGAAEEPALPSPDSPSTDRFALNAAAGTATESADAETEAPPEWGETPAESAQEAGSEAALSSSDAASEVATHEFAAEEAQQSAVAEEPRSEFAEERQPEFAAEESLPAFATEEPQPAFSSEEPQPAFPSEEPQPAFSAEDQQPPAEEPQHEFAAEEPAASGEMKLEGWVPPPSEPEPQGAGWLGQALEATAPLSAADHGTLASIGVDPNDGIGALRLLAALVRVLNRGQQLDLNEVAVEIRESRAQGAAEHAAAEAESNGTPTAPEAAPAEPAET